MTRRTGRPPRTPRTDLHRRVGERGSAVVEVVLLAPVLGMLLALLIVGGRLAMAEQAVQAAASEAARTASLARTHTEAGSSAQAAAVSGLQAQQVNCLDVTVQVDTSGFTAPVGTPASVAATVTCRVNLAGLLPAVPGSIVLSSSSSSPLDTYRER
ncbi:pilus assembly protein [Nostocoides sp. F2B08]|uniref:TadE/TadG family type IV pilus assembly protein n=1 Tax=Nostocoides sp. F2B08 TaxID=2653936 RepID=UPI001263D6E7|nr:TadE/TadG family type IV pilus assembly protein [Tetrasphaera sp. F2B08]KAB7740054.1 pilus assembly protein [Tetrasphaera sp. F2B08]